MASVTEAYTGVETIGTTEWNLPTDSSSIGALTVAGCFKPWLDLSALTVTETYELKIYEKVTSGATQRLHALVTFQGVQGEPLWSPPGAYDLMAGWTMTLKKLAGTDRSITWSIRKIGP